MPYFIGSILELPVTMTQDYSLFHLLGQHSIDLWKFEMEQVMEKHGLASFIVHPDYILDRQARGIYKSLLAYLATLRTDGKIWMALPHEVNDWWRMRSRMKLKRQGNNWVIEGPGKHKARLAYAVLSGEQLSYEIVCSQQAPQVLARSSTRIPSFAALGSPISSRS
jgi:hypothetical protein